MEQIERLEIRIEELEKRSSAAEGSCWLDKRARSLDRQCLFAFMLGLIDFTPIRMNVGIALAIGGVVLTGSSKASTEPLMLSLKRTEEERSAAMDALELVQLPV